MSKFQISIFDAKQSQLRCEGWRDGHKGPGLLLHRSMSAGIMSLSPACKPELPSAVLIDEAGSQLALAAPENTLSPGKWSWVGKKEYGMVPAALPTSGGDRSCHGDDVRAALAGHHGQGVGMEGPAGRQQVTQDLPFLAAHSPACNPPLCTSSPREQGRGDAKGWRVPDGALLGLAPGRVPSSGLSPWSLLSG